ncbi:MAG: hypothetical protein ACI9VT_004099 [Psychroserpens sp.]|jgi:hypothetical protein
MKFNVNFQEGFSTKITALALLVTGKRRVKTENTKEA